MQSTRTLALTALGAIACAELVTTYINPLYGVLFHIVLLGVFLSLGALIPYPRQQAFILSLSVMPLVRILSLGMPLTQFPQIYWYVLTAIPLFASTYMVARTLGFSPRDLGLQLAQRRLLLLDLAVALSGFGLGYVEWRILGVKSIVAAHAPDRAVLIVLAALILLVCTGFLEEIVFRGLIQRVSIGLLGSRWGLAFSAVLFAALHIGWRSIADFGFVFLVAVYFGLVVQKTRSLLGVTLAHGATNTMLFVILPLAALR